MPQFVINMSAAVSDVNTESLTKIFSKKVTMLLMVYILKKLKFFLSCKLSKITSFVNPHLTLFL